MYVFRRAAHNVVVAKSNSNGHLAWLYWLVTEWIEGVVRNRLADVFENLEIRGSRDYIIREGEIQRLIASFYGILQVEADI